jgi:hypothetical protein
VRAATKVPFKGGTQDRGQGREWGGQDDVTSPHGVATPRSFAAELARRLSVSHIELDALHHGPNWSEPSADEFRVRVRAAMAANPHGWVIDGKIDSWSDRSVHW